MRATYGTLVLRPVAVVLCILLAGCAQPAEDEEDPLFGLCPQWLQGPGHDTVSVTLDAGSTTDSTLVQPMQDGQLREEYLGRSLDLYRITFESISVSEGTVQMRAFAADEQRAIRDYRIDGAQLLPVVHLTSDDQGREFDVALTPISHELEGQPSALRFNWTFDPVGTTGSASITGNVTYHYRVCGADL